MALAQVPQVAPEDLSKAWTELTQADAELIKKTEELEQAKQSPEAKAWVEWSKNINGGNPNGGLKPPVQPIALQTKIKELNDAQTIKNTKQQAFNTAEQKYKDKMCEEIKLLFETKSPGKWLWYKNINRKDASEGQLIGDPIMYFNQNIMWLQMKLTAIALIHGKWIKPPTSDNQVFGEIANTDKLMIVDTQQRGKTICPAVAMESNLFNQLHQDNEYTGHTDKAQWENKNEGAIPARLEMENLYGIYNGYNGIDGYLQGRNGYLGMLYMYTLWLIEIVLLFFYVVYSVSDEWSLYGSDIEMRLMGLIVVGLGFIVCCIGCVIYLGGLYLCWKCQDKTRKNGESMNVTEREFA